MPEPVLIRRYLDVAQSPSALAAALDKIFFEASNTKSFSDDAARRAFRERWLGRYLRDEPRFAYLAMTPPEQPVGYLVGSPGSSLEDGAREAPSGIAEFAGWLDRFPAHLHVNVDPAFRGAGIGGRLIDAFVTDLCRDNIAGVHVVTAANARNVRFYDRNGFVEVGRGGPGNALVCLGRSLR